MTAELLDRKFWLAPSAWPKGNREWTFLGDALLVVGKALFGDAWSGKEINVFPFDVHSARRLEGAMEWIATRCRDDEVPVAMQLEGSLKVRQIAQPIWNIPCAAKRFRRCRFYPGAPLVDFDNDREWAFIFVGAKDLSHQVAGLPHAKLIVSSTELGRYSPLLQYAVALAQRWDLTSAEHQEKRISMEANIEEAWAKDRPGEILSGVTLKAISQLIRFPDREAIQQGQSRRPPAKNG